MKHCFTAFWRPDVLATLQARGATVSALCGDMAPAQSATADKAEVSCPECLRFLNAKNHITGIDWTRYPADIDGTEIVPSIPPAEPAKPSSGWTTAAPAKGWTSAPPTGGWRTR